MVDAYNHWMGCVGLDDERIAYYHPNLKCHKTWIPIFLQGLSIIRNNIFLIFQKDQTQKKSKRLEMVSVLMQTAHHAKAQNLHFQLIWTFPILSSIHKNHHQHLIQDSIATVMWVSSRTFRTSSTGSTANLPKRINKDKISIYSFQKLHHLPISLHIHYTQGNKHSRCIYCSIQFKVRDEDAGGSEVNLTVCTVIV